MLSIWIKFSIFILQCQPPIIHYSWLHTFCKWMIMDYPNMFMLSGFWPSTGWYQDTRCVFCWSKCCIWALGSIIIFSIRLFQTYVTFCHIVHSNQPSNWMKNTFLGELGWVFAFLHSLLCHRSVSRRPRKDTINPSKIHSTFKKTWCVVHCL